MAAARLRGESDTGVSQARPRNDAYTGMLLISLGALMIGCVLLLLDYFSYGEGQPAKPAAVGPAQKAPAAPKTDR
jgi:hypothetical protein